MAIISLLLSKQNTVRLSCMAVDNNIFPQTWPPKRTQVTLVRSLKWKRMWQHKRITYAFFPSVKTYIQILFIHGERQKYLPLWRSIFAVCLRMWTCIMCGRKDQWQFSLERINAFSISNTRSRTLLSLEGKLCIDVSFCLYKLSISRHC